MYGTLRGALAGRKIAFDRESFKATVEGRISGIGKTIRITSIHVHYDVAAAARAAGLDGLLTGDSHGGNPGYAATFSPLPTVARLMSVTGDMPIGVVLLAPFYHPFLLAEQIGTLAAFAQGPLIVTFVLGGRPQQFQALGMEEGSRVSRLEEVVTLTRALLSGERVNHR